jgi:large conductance mechanosensitive channel
MIGKFLKEFRNFAERGSAIDMAVGIIVGSAMTSMVNSLVKDVIMPPIGILLGGMDFSQIFFTLKHGSDGVQHYHTIAAAQAAGATTLNIGMFINSIVSFIITMFAIFMFVRIANRMRSNKFATRKCPYCCSSVSMAAIKCPYCTSALEPVKSESAQDGIDKLINNLATPIKDLGSIVPIKNLRKTIKKVTERK